MSATNQCALLTAVPDVFTCFTFAKAIKAAAEVVAVEVVAEEVATSAAVAFDWSAAAAVRGVAMGAATTQPRFNCSPALIAIKRMVVPRLGAFTTAPLHRLLFG